MNIEAVIKQKKFENIFQKAIINLIYTSNCVNSFQTKLFKKFEIVPQHYNILRILKGQYPNSICPGEIKEVMLDKNPDLTRLLDKLEKLGLISRKMCVDNRRKMDVKITKKGLVFLEKIRPEIDKLNDEIVNNISAEEAEILSNLLDKFRG